MVPRFCASGGEQRRMTAARKGSVDGPRCGWMCWVWSCSALAVSRGFFTWPEPGCERTSVPLRGWLGSAGVGSSVHRGGGSRWRWCGVLGVLARDCLLAGNPRAAVLAQVLASLISSDTLSSSRGCPRRVRWCAHSLRSVVPRLCKAGGTVPVLQGELKKKTNYGKCRYTKSEKTEH